MTCSRCGAEMVQTKPAKNVAERGFVGVAGGIILSGLAALTWPLSLAVVATTGLMGAGSGMARWECPNGCPDDSMPVCC
jgi:hypothetical protein